jgi:sugar phosphate permease
LDGLISAPNLSYPELIAPLILAGCGASMTLPATQNTVINSIAASEIGKVSGAFSMLGQLGGVFGVAILAAVFAGSGGFGSALTFSKGFIPAMDVSAGLAFLGSLVGLALSWGAPESRGLRRRKMKHTARWNILQACKLKDSMERKRACLRPGKQAIFPSSFCILQWQGVICWFPLGKRVVTIVRYKRSL